MKLFANFALPTAVAVTLACTTCFAVADGLTLSRALSMAYENSAQLEANRAALRQADEGVASAMSALRPSVSASASASLSRDFETDSSTRNGQASISLNQLLYDGGQSSLGIEAARMSVLATRQSLIDVEQSILLDAVTAFMDVRRDRDQVNLARNNVSVLRQQVQAAQDRFDVGEITRTDVSQTETRLAQAISSLEGANGNLRSSEEAFFAAIGQRPGKLHAPSGGPKLPNSSASAEAFAISNHPRVIEAEFLVKEAEADMAAAELNKSVQITGSISLTSQWRSGTGGESDALTGTLSATKPIYQGGLYKSQRRSQLANLERTQANLRLNREGTRQRVAQAYASWQTAQASKEAVRAQIRSAELTYEGVREEANFGARTTLDVLDAEQDLLQARSDFISAVRNELVAAYTVLSEMGQLTVSDQNLGVEEYNPDINYSSVTAPSKLGEHRSNLLDKLLKR